MYAASILALTVLALAPQEEARDDSPYASAQAQPVRLQGRILLSEEEPAADVLLRFEGEPVLVQTAGVIQAPPPFEELSARTDADGRFSMEFEPLDNMQFVLHVDSGTHLSERLRWPGFRGRSSVDLGDLVLRSAGALEGRLLGADGEPLPAHWEIHVEGAQHPGFRDYDPAHGARLERIRTRTFPSGSEGRFRVEGLPPGPCRVTVVLDAAGSMPPVVVEIEAGKTANVEPRYEGPPLGKRVHVRVSSPPVYYAYPDLESITLHGPGNTRLHPLTNDLVRGGLDFDGLEQGRYRLEIDDPRFRPVTIDDLSPGMGSLDVSLVGTSAVQLIVDDGYEPRAVGDLDVQLRLEDTTFPADENPWLKKTGAGASAVVARSGLLNLHRFAFDGPFVRSTITGLVAGDYTLILRSPERAPRFVPLYDFEPGETRKIEAKLVEGGALVGRVLEADGHPAPLRTRVTLFAPGREREPPLGRIYLEGSPPETLLGQGFERADAYTDGDGNYALEHVHPGTYTLRIRVRGRADQWVEGVVVEDRQLKERVFTL